MNDEIQPQAGLAGLRRRLLGSEAEAGPRLFLYLCVAAVAAFGIWASVGTLAVVSTATGEVIPSSEVKTIQHLEGGIVREIRVHEGDRVEAGQPLVVLESTASAADVTELRARITGLRIEMARLQAEATGAEAPEFPPELVQTNPELVRESQNLFDSRRTRLKNEKASQTAYIAQREQDIREITAHTANTRQSLKLLNEQIKISEDLLKDDLTNRYNHLNLLKEQATLQGSLATDQAGLERARSALTQARVNLERIDNNFAEDVRGSMEQDRRALDEAIPRLAKYEDSLKRTVLRSPVAGVVKTLHVVTVGGVVTPGQAVVDVVPANDRLIIEAQLATQDIGFVRAGQSALIKLASNDARRFDSLEGKVVEVSPDALQTPDGVPFYRVRIETARDHFQRGANRYDLFPGMQVVASIHTGERTVMEYLIDPYLSSSDVALTER